MYCSYPKGDQLNSQCASFFSVVIKQLFLYFTFEFCCFTLLLSPCHLLSFQTKRVFPFQVLIILLLLLIMLHSAVPYGNFSFCLVFLPSDCPKKCPISTKPTSLKRVRLEIYSSEIYSWKPGNLLSREHKHEEIFHTNLFFYYELLLLLCVTTGHLHITDTNCSSAQLRGWDNCVFFKEVNWAVYLLSDLPKAIHEFSKLATEPRSPGFLLCPRTVSALCCLAGYCNSAQHLSWPSELLLTKPCSVHTATFLTSQHEFSIIVSTAE